MGESQESEPEVFEDRHTNRRHAANNSSSQNSENSKDSYFIKNYPFIEIKPIPWDPPSVYFQQKVKPKPLPEPAPPPKLVFRDVDPEKLSEDQKKFAGKSLFEKDMIIITARQSMSAKRSESARKDKIHKRIHEQPPNMFYREEKERQIQRAEKDRHDRILEKKKIRQEKRKKKKFEKEKKKIDSITRERESERLYYEQKMMEEKEKEFLEKQKKFEKLLKSPQKPTKAATLRMEANKHRIDIEAANQQREKLKQEMNKERQKKQTKRIAPMIEEMNPEYNYVSRARQKKEALLKQEMQWKKWLKMNAQSIEHKETMLERLFYAD
ncbi:hypothetical protein TRFO_14472 [Tritrichomonas foetus]|uniref:Uncharacterized protein n=1 Tax=Tritrichomonas foetus TaxID=1144522 RepID=A0A1J4KW57_9EUKA|nr:hypothetical protein TRFO_14472 [Tritrichomonas foetus]|eukprot:OHT15112.1 hypothetical protein TRFO_14472 [Tritrichomonas foetus]